MVSFSPVSTEQEMLHSYKDLFFTCFSESAKFQPNTLKWLYTDNPDGTVVGFNAFDGNKLVAHYVCIPAKIRINNTSVKALLSLNTATHPDYQGKGLFSKLAEMTYQMAAEQGFDCIYGVANANSTPGFIRKLGFQLVQPLHAMVGIGSLHIDFKQVALNSQFERIWSPESLRWRCANPINPITEFRIGHNIGLQAKAMSRFLSIYTELPGTIRSAVHDVRPPLSPFHLFLGLFPEGCCNFKRYMHIPHQFRPSPLNLIFRSLTTPGLQLDAQHIHFSFLDFDAY